MTINETEVTIITVMYALAMLVAIVGNILLIYIVWRKPEVRSLTSSMFVNMAVADLLVAFFVMPFAISELNTGSQWKISGVFADVTCRSLSLVSYATQMASILCFVFMAIDRYCAVVCPLKFTYVWFRKGKFVTPLIWVASMALTAIVPFFFKLNYSYDKPYCDFNPNLFGSQTKTFRGMFLYTFVNSYMIPLVIISPLYAKAAYKIRFSRAPGNPLVEEQQRRQAASKKKVVRMLIIIVVVFALGWLPTQAIHLFLAVTTFRVSFLAIAMHLGFWLGHANSAINPWLYIILSTKIRSALIRMVSFRASHKDPRQSTQRTSRSHNSLIESKV